MTIDRKTQEFAQVFRCTLDAAPTYIARIHERMGREVPMDSILAVMRKIAPKRLTMDTIIERLKKLDQAPSRTRAARADADDDLPEIEGGEKPKAAALRKPAAPAPSGPMKQIGNLLAANWDRARSHGLKPPVMTAEMFTRRAQSLAGTPRPTVARILQAVRKLDRRDVLITPNLVADAISGSET